MKLKNNLIKTAVLLSMSLMPVSFIACEDDETTIKETTEDNLPNISGYPIVGTNQTTFYGNVDEITAPSQGEAFYGQDAHYIGIEPSYTNNGDGTVTDNITGLMWSQSPDFNGDGTVDSEDKMSYSDALAGASTFNLNDYDDWRLPTIKELYSIFLLSGIDPDIDATNSDGVVPFIDTDYFDFGYGDIDEGERIIDAQFATSTLYVSTVVHNEQSMFGVNFADGRIKGYPSSTMTGDTYNIYYVRYVRGNTSYGINNFTENGDATITDAASGLMWSQDDNGEGVDWEDALTYAEASDLAGYTDWRLPDAKELHSIVDYTRSPETSNSAAIDPVFNSTEIINEADEADYPYYWSGSTHYADTRSGANAVYIAFGRGLGSIDGEIIDVHGAGCQRDDVKEAMSGGGEDDGETAPQGDIGRTYNYVRLVRDAN